MESNVFSGIKTPKSLDILLKILIKFCLFFLI